MRNLLVASIVVALLAAPSLGIINIKLTADGPIVGGKVQLNNGQTTTIYLWGQATAGLYSLAGDVKAGLNDPVLLTSNAGSLDFSPAFTPLPEYADKSWGNPKPGIAGPNGGWSSFGSIQIDPLQPNSSIGAPPGWALFCQYTVVAAPTGMGDVALAFEGKSVSGYKPIETDKTGIIGSNTPLTIHVIPEPAPLALLAFGGLLASRRRK